MKLEIEAVSNGYILRCLDDDEHDTPPVTSVFGNGDDLPDARTFADLLHEIRDLIGPADSRYDPERVYIELRPGDKYEPPKDGWTLTEPDNAPEFEATGVDNAK